MRRNITTTAGRNLCHLIIGALLLPFVSFMTVGRAEAQIAQNPSWVVVEFVDRDNLKSPYGADAAQKVRDALANAPRADYVIETADTINRYIEELGLVAPVVEKTSLLRLAAHARAATIVTGELFSYHVEDVGGGRQAHVAVRVLVLDGASGLAVNGAVVERASSSVRSSSTEEGVLVNEALAAAADMAIAKIRSTSLPTATVLNTRNDDALINRGSRDGFKSQMEVLILRGREQVAVGIIGDVEPDSASVRITRSDRGIQPGDKVRPIFDVPRLTGARNATAKPSTVKKRGSTNVGPMITMALVLGLLVFALSGSNANRVDAAQDVSARPTVDVDGIQGNLVKWRLDFFFRSTQNNVQWQLWRNDVIATPVKVTEGQNTQMLDKIGEVGNIQWDNFQGNFASSTCHHANRPLATATRNDPVPGRQYSYEVALIYRIAGQDLPEASREDWCYFTTQKTPASGLATVYGPVRLISPAPDQLLTNFTSFTFSSVVNPTFPSQVEYVLQFSDSALFRGKVWTSDPVQSSNTTNRSITLKPRAAGDTFQKFLTDNFGSVDTIYWRVGVRNLADSPGPVPDPDTGVPYLFTPRLGQAFKRPIAPPSN